MVNQRRTPWPWIWAALCVALVYRTGVRERGVITDHLEFGRRLFQGEFVYAPFGGGALHPPYPPSFGLLAGPFALLPEQVARFGWGFAQVAALVGLGLCLRQLLRQCWPALEHRFHWLMLGALLLTSRYVLRDTHGGGGNLINLALALGAWVLAERRPKIAGVLLGFSLATKPTQVLLLPLLWLCGHRRAVLWTAVSGLGWLLLSLVLLRFDPSSWVRWFEGTWAYLRMESPFAEPAYGFPPFSWMNQALRCALARYLGEVPPELAAQVPGFFPGLGWSSGTVAWLVRGAGLVLLSASGIAAWRSRGSPVGRSWTLAAVITLSLLLSPITWKSYHVALLPTFFLLLAHAVQHRCRWVWVLVVLYVPTCLLGEELTGKAAKNLQQSLYVFTAWALVLWGVCILRQRCQTPYVAHSQP